MTRGCWLVIADSGGRGGAHTGRPAAKQGEAESCRYGVPRRNHLNRVRQSRSSLHQLLADACGHGWGWVSQKRGQVFLRVTSVHLDDENDKVQPSPRTPTGGTYTCEPASIARCIPASSQNAGAVAAGVCCEQRQAAVDTDS